MRAPDHDRIEELLAEALAAFDRGGDTDLQRFLDRQGGDRPALERGLNRCRQLGLLGPSATPRAFPERLGEFRLLRRLGSGGMGVVYEAEQESLGRRVALKVVRPELLYFEGARERFRREIEAVARLSHPAVVPVLASGEQDGVPWYAMELLSGRTVQELCVDLAGTPPAKLTGDDLRRAIGIGQADGTDPLHGAWWQICARIAHTAALGVRHAHLRGIVHRDIKPSNLMLTQDGRTVLLDFGVARIGGSREFTRSGQTPGSPAFMSPEQLRGEAIDERTDIYSLGATLWQLLTLKAPFRADGDLQPIRDGAVPPLRAHNREVPRELVLVVQKAMDRDRERRYADAEALAADLEAVLQRRPIRARGIGLPLRSWRWCQRHRVTATALAALLLTGLLLPALFAWRERALNRDLELAVTTANTSLETTLSAVYSQLVTVSDDRLRYVPAAEALSRELLRDACAMYRDLLRQHPEHQRVRGNAGEAFDHYALRLAHTGDLAGAERLLQEVVTLFHGEGPDTPAALTKRALAHIHLGDLAIRRMDLPTVARELAAAERDLVSAAVDATLAVELARLRVEIDLKRVGLLDPLREAERMERECRAAITSARAIVARPGAIAQDIRQLVVLLDLLGTLLGKVDRHDDALPPLEEALALARAMPAAAKVWPPQPQVVADVLLTLGNTLVSKRDLKAVPLLQECLELQERGAADRPEDLQQRCELGAALHALANLNFHQEQDERALTRLDRAIPLQRSVVAGLPSFARSREYLRNHLTLRGSTLARLRRAPELHADLTELAGMTTDPIAQRTAARLWLRLARLWEDATIAADLPTPAQCRDQAMACLLTADRLGWGPRNPLGESLYDPLRTLPEFVALQQRVADRLRPAAKPADQPAVSPPSTSSANREMPR